MEKDLISILVPVYNIHRYIGECLDSLLAQTYKNIEIILVDNGSDDGSYEICQEYAARDTRIRLFRAGVRQQYIARNKTVEEIRGKYYCFVDGDDYVSKNYVKMMYDVMSQYDVDLVTCGMTAMVEARNIKFGVNHKIYKTNDRKELRGNIVCKLYRTDVFQSLRFDDLRMGCDAAYCNKVLKVSCNGAICGYNLYAARAYISSVTHIFLDKAFYDNLDRFISDKNAKDFKNSAEKCIQIIHQRHEEQLFHKELSLLKDRVEKARKHSIEISEPMYQQLQTMLELSQVNFIKYCYLKLKYFYTSHCAAFRRMINYRCRLD